MISAYIMEVGRLATKHLFSRFLWKIIISLTCAAVLFQAVSYTANWLAKPSSDVVKLDHFQNYHSSAKKVLPVSLVTNPNNDSQHVSGTIVLDIDKEFSDPALFVPYFDGSLTLWLDGVIIKASSVLEVRGSSVARLTPYLIAIESEVLRQAKTLSFLIQDSIDPELSSFLTLSKIYVGEHAEFTSILYRKKIFEEVFRPAAMFSLGAGLFVLLLIIIFAKVGMEAAPLAIIISYMLAISIGSLEFIWPQLMPLHRYAYILTPVGMASVNAYISMMVKPGFAPKDIWISASAMIIMSIELIVAQIDTFNFSITQQNLFINMPILFLGIFALAMRALLLSRFFMKNELMAISVMLFLTLFSFINDLGGRLGLFDISVPFTSISLMILFITLCLFFAISIVNAKNNLETINDNIKIALHEQSIQLEMEHHSASEMRERVSLARNYEKIYDDLHDGVLTYLFAIKTIGESKAISKDSKVATLAQFCVNEIRVILSSGVTGKTPLIRSLSNLRHNIYDSLPDIGIETDWNITSLLEMPPTDLRFNLEIVRVLQEAVHNAVQRAQCSSLSVTATLGTDKRIRFKIMNQGGLSFCENYKEGFGLKSMNARIIRLGGSFSILPCIGGAVLTFEVPCPESV